MVAVAHPDLLARLEALEQQRIGRPWTPIDVEHRLAVFAQIRLCNFAPELMGHKLHAVADAQNRDPQLEKAFVADGNAFIKNAGRPS